jgi:hypothetical protein
MATEDLTETIKRELPGLLRSDPSLRRFILDLTKERYADRDQTEDRFDKILDELRRDREEQARKWEEARREDNRKWEEQTREQNLKWEEQNVKWEEQNRRWEEQTRDQNLKWEEQNLKWEEQNRRWEEQTREQGLKWEEQSRKWEESSLRFDRLHEEIMAQAKKFDRSIGALGARWGLRSEAAFRKALAGILEESFGVEVINVNEYDDRGEVFGRPDQVELDVIIKNGLLLICELKSSMTKADMYTFERKARFYEQRHHGKADRLIAVSPMIDPRALKVAEKLGIETYSDSLEVPAVAGDQD